MLCHVCEEKNISGRDKSNTDTSLSKRSNEVPIFALSQRPLVTQEKKTGEDIFVIGACNNDGPNRRQVKAGSG